MGRVFLVAAHPMLREALITFLPMQSHGQLTVVGTASWHPDDLAALTTIAPDVVVVAIGIEARQDLHALEQIRTLAPHTPLAVITTMRCLVCEMAMALGVIDALLIAEHLPEDLVRVVQQLVNARDASSPSPLLQPQANNVAQG